MSPASRVPAPLAALEVPFCGGKGRVPDRGAPLAVRGVQTNRER